MSNSSTFGYDCSVLTRYPFQGSEVLIFGSLFLFLIVMWSIVYADVVIKQWMPTKFLDPNVLARIAQVQKAFPNLTLTDEEKKHLYEKPAQQQDSTATSVSVSPAPHHATLEDGTTVRYDAVCAAEAYISGKTVDLDLLVSMSNNSAYCTMSQYSAATTRGYNMLATMLSGTAFSCSFLALHNFIVDPRAGETGWLGVKWGVLALCFYPFILGTSIVMTSVGHSVYRDSNICLFTNIPYTLNGKYNPVRHCHLWGVILFGLVPMVSHIVQMLSWGEQTMPNYAQAKTLMLATLAGGLILAASQLFGTSWLPNTTGVQGSKVMILGEWLMMLGCFLTFLHWETYPTMYCTGQADTFNKMLFSAFFSPLACIAKSQLWAPTDYTTQPALMLMYQNKPVAVVGPAPAQAYHGDEFAGSTTSKPTGLLPRAKME